MKYKVGDKVNVKSIDWYNENKDGDGFVHCGDKFFDNYMSIFCGSVVTIGGEYLYCGYDVREDIHCRIWTDEMFEGIADVEPHEKMVSLDKVCDMLYAMLTTQDINDYDYVTAPAYDNVKDFVNDFRKTMEK